MSSILVCLLFLANNLTALLINSLAEMFLELVMHFLSMHKLFLYAYKLLTCLQNALLKFKACILMRLLLLRYLSAYLTLTAIQTFTPQ
jgi:hypothetical protein